MNQRLTMLAVAATAVGAFVVSGSAAAPTADGGARQTAPLIRLAVNTPINLLDQAHEAGGYGPSITNLMLETLMKFGPDGSVQPNLAQSVRIPNPFTYVYTLRKGVRFWDGNELTATDVANAMNYYRYPGTQTAHYYSSVRNIVAKDRYTVIVTLKKRDASWGPISAFATMIFEKKFEDAHKGTMGRPSAGIMGTGPWKLESFDPTRGIEMSANPRYWGGPVAIKRVSVKIIPDPTAQALAFRSGAIDFVPAVLDVVGFKGTSGADVKSVPSCGLTEMSMNVNQPPWNDVHVRRAVAYAINKTDLIKASGAPAIPLTTLIPPILLRTLGSQSAVTAAVKSINPYTFNLAKARQELAQSRYPNGFSAEINSYEYGTSAQEIQVLAAQLSKIGIKLQLNKMTITEILGKWFGPREKLGLEYFKGTGCFPDVAFLPNLLLRGKDARAGALNTADYKSPLVDSLINQGLATTNPSKRLGIYTRMLRTVANDVPWLGLYSPTQNYALTDKFTWKSGTIGFWFAQSDWLLDVKPR